LREFGLISNVIVPYQHGQKAPAKQQWLRQAIQMEPPSKVCLGLAPPTRKNDTMSPARLPRRSFLKLGIASAVVLAVGGGAVALMQPGLVGGRLSPAARTAMGKIGQALLAGTLPSEPTALQAALDALLQRTDAFLSGLPLPVVAELDQLLALMVSAPGRRFLVGVSSSWAEATAAEVGAALQGMRSSGLALRIQAYQGLHDIVCAPYFSGEESWAVLGYPGPTAI
jgi:hypothetical protein